MVLLIYLVVLFSTLPHVLVNGRSDARDLRRHAVRDNESMIYISNNNNTNAKLTLNSTEKFTTIEIALNDTQDLIAAIQALTSAMTILQNHVIALAPTTTTIDTATTTNTANATSSSKAAPINTITSTMSNLLSSISTITDLVHKAVHTMLSWRQLRHLRHLRYLPALAFVQGMVSCWLGEQSWTSPAYNL